MQLLLRTFGGLLESTGFAKYQRPAPSSGYARFATPDDGVHTTYAFREREGRWETAPLTKVSGDFAERFAALEWATPDAMPDNQRDPWIQLAAERLQPAFLRTEDAGRLRNCSQWHFDSMCGSNHLLRFVQATVAIEILLGDKATSDRVGLGDLLANRCAYSLAKDARERQTLLVDFKNIYDTRSRIVHRGKADLTKEETEQLWTLMWLARRLIQHELNLLKVTARA
jgi:hypothetical protein